jgi:hypothetical protein
MTWRFRVQSVVFALVVLGALAMAAGNGWVDDSSFCFFGF